MNNLARLSAVCVFSFFLMLTLAVIQSGCESTPTNPGQSGNPYGGSPPAPTPTASSSGATTITVSTASVSTSVSSTGYIYTANGATTAAGGTLEITAHVGDALALPGSSLHPLYFDAGTSTCIYSGATSDQTYTIPATGTYYFHCGNHGAGCSNGDGACGSTNCSAMAGLVTVN